MNLWNKSQEILFLIIPGLLLRYLNYLTKPMMEGMLHIGQKIIKVKNRHCRLEIR